MSGSSKLAFLMDGSLEGNELPKQFRWTEQDDGTWEYSNGSQTGTGHFITAAYQGAHGSSSPNHQPLHLGDVLGITNGKCWRVKASDTGYEDSDGVLVQITGKVRGLGVNWLPGNRVYLPFYDYGKPEQMRRSRQDRIPVGLAVNDTDLLLSAR